MSGLAQEQETAVSAPTTPEPTNNVESSQDAWADAHEAFSEGGEIENEGNSVIIGDDTPETGAKDSHLEVKEPEKETEQEIVEDDPNGLNISLDKLGLDATNIPHKYRPLINEKVNSLIQDAKRQFSEKVSDYQGSNQALATAFVDVMRSENPVEALYELAKEAVPKLGLSNEILANFESKLGTKQPTNQNQNTPPVDLGNLAARVQVEVDKVRQEFDEQIFKTEDPREFMRLMDARNTRIQALNEAVGNAKLKAVLTAYHNQLVQPNLGKIKDVVSESENAKAQANYQRQLGSWNDADKSMTTDFKDWSKYRTQVKQLMKTKYAMQKDQANNTGVGHLDLMKDLYYVVSRNDHLQSANKTTRGNPGIRPETKHIQTQKAGGSDWDSIRDDIWGDVIPNHD